MLEIVCVLTNEAMEGMGKIGRETTNLEQCVKEFDNSSLPLPFQCFYAAEIGDLSFVEGKSQHIFSDKRIRIDREFFSIDANQVREAFRRAEFKGCRARSRCFCR